MAFQTYEEAVEWLHSRLRLGMKPGLKRMEWMMEKLRYPNRRLKTIHIGGTNGKGSTVQYLSKILQEAEYTVGTFTSPYFEHFNERMSVNGNPINKYDLLKAANVIKPLADELEKTELGGPTEFEIITAMSIYYFAHIHPVDVVLYEVGLGGRYDSTNVIFPILTIITNIGLDHTNILGDTIEKIAFEKAGIIKSGVRVVTAVKQEEALKVIEEVANEKRTSIYRLGKQFFINNHCSIEDGEIFDVQTLYKTFKGLEVPMIGKHQTENASLAVMASILLNQFYAFQIDEEHIYNGLKKAYWPGRFEKISQSPLVIIDGAHNREGMEALVQELKSRYKYKKLKFIVTFLNDKNIKEILQVVDPVADKITFVQFDYPRASKCKDLWEMSECANKFYEEDWKKAIQEEMGNLHNDEMLVITGSLYFLSEAKPFLQQLVTTRGF